MDLSGYTLATLHQDTEFVLCRARATANPTRHPESVLVSMPTSAHPAPDRVRMLEHELAPSAELDSAWAVRPLALAQYQGRAALILEDKTGESLERLLDTPTVNRAPGAQRSAEPAMDLGLFLRVAISLARVLGEVHRRGIIHKDVKPAHVLVNVATGQTWFTGFRIASRLPRERQTPDPPETIAGTLAYMAPEQTGRMNRPIDAGAISTRSVRRSTRCSRGRCRSPPSNRSSGCTATSRDSRSRLVIESRTFRRRSRPSS